MTRYNHEFPCEVVASLFIGAVFGALVYVAGSLYGATSDFVLKMSLICGGLFAALFFLLFRICWQIGQRSAETERLRRVILEHWDITGLR